MMLFCGRIMHPDSSSQGFSRPAVFALRRCSIHQLFQSKIAPSRLFHFLRCALDAKGCMLVGDNIILVVRVNGLVLRRDVDFLGREFETREVL